MTPRLDPHVAIAALEGAPMGALVVDEAGQVSWANATLHRWITTGGGDIDLEHEFRRLLEPQDVLSLPASGERPLRWLRCTRLGGPTGTTIHLYQDVTDYHQLLLEAERLRDDLALHATRDPLTSLPNRRALLQGLESQVSRSRRYGNPLSVMVLTLDGLASLKLEDESAMEHIIVTTAQLLKDQMRWVDMIGRLDENEFLLILPETTEEAGWVLRDKLLTLLSERLAASSRRALRVRTGMGSWTKGDDGLRLLRRARQMMEEAAHSASV